MGRIFGLADPTNSVFRTKKLSIGYLFDPRQSEVRNATLGCVRKC